MDFPRGASLPRNTALVMRIAPEPVLWIAPPSPRTGTMMEVFDQIAALGQLSGTPGNEMHLCVNNAIKIRVGLSKQTNLNMVSLVSRLFYPRPIVLGYCCDPEVRQASHAIVFHLHPVHRAPSACRVAPVRTPRRCEMRDHCTG